MRQIETTNYKRISKAAARKIYENNGELYIIPHKLNPESPWGLLLGPVNTFEPFDSMVQWATWYNCDSERGWYLAFYIKKGGNE
jgi:hypothetical protein